MMLEGFKAEGLYSGVDAVRKGGKAYDYIFNQSYKVGTIVQG